MLDTQYQDFVAASRYARWLPEEGRRETWEETVQRYAQFWDTKLGLHDLWDTNEKLAEEFDTAISDFTQAILNLEVMPSMRCLMTAGPALERDNVAGFNCSYIPIDHPRSFDELMYILLCGTGVGFSVERQYIGKLPEVAEEFHPTETTIVVPDSKIGWAKSFRQLVSLLYAGELPEWDVSKVRGAGEPLKTFGGRASGPQPLVDLFTFTCELFQKAAGRRLSSIEAHDLCCKIAEVIVVGGVRRSALISLSNPSDSRLRGAKSGQWWLDNPQRALANNSACYTERPEFDFFLDEMRALYESKSGERGLFSRRAAQKVAERNGRRDSEVEFGTNPCSEIILRPNQFCNLTEVVIRSEDTLEVLKEKVRMAAILGTLQATLTDFRYLRKVWKTNTEEEALLGLSLTGIMDHPMLSSRHEHAGGALGDWLNELKEVAIATNKEWAKKLGINPAAAITCVKPSGTVSQLVNSASGIHPRFAPYYVRTVRADSKDPMAQYMQEAGFPWEVDVTKASTLVFSFPVKSPEGAVCTSEVGALEQLRLWKVYQDSWCEHKPSITVYYRDDEFLDVCSWLWKNFDLVSGISLLPYSDHTYQQAPYQEITKDEYEELCSTMPSFNWESMARFEHGTDTTLGSQELACAGGACELP
jgi:ribonucleoside-diphosphate reductase alpha chain